MGCQSRVFVLPRGEGELTGKVSLPSTLLSTHLPEPQVLKWGWECEGGMAALQPSKEPLPLFLRLRGKADLLWGWVILLAR